MSGDVQEPTLRGDYLELWKHHEGGILIYVSRECVIRIDANGDLDWETTQEYDSAIADRPGFDEKKRAAILNEVALLEVTPCEGVSKQTHTHFKRLLGEALRCCIALEYPSSQSMLGSARAFIKARAEETSRQWYLTASFLSVVPFLLLGLVVWIWRVFFMEILGADMVWFLIASSMGALGALLSVIARSGQLKFDCSAGKYLHYLEGGSRISAGAISGLLVALAIRSEIIFSALSQGQRLQLVMLLGALVAGAGERLATSIISKFDATHPGELNGKTKTSKEDRN